MKHFIIFSLLICFFSCKNIPDPTKSIDYDESSDLVESAEHENVRMRYKLIQSKLKDNIQLLKTIDIQLNDFSEDDYLQVKPLILESDILTLQNHIKENNLTYKKLVQWYLYRIRKFEFSKSTSLHAIISINPKAVELAISLDKKRSNSQHPIYGMPILLKDNINTKDMPTTAGAFALADNNKTNDAFIVERLKSKGAIILAKVNLSEWAYFFCDKCPLGYSAIGGQTLNPYGRKIFETGGSSAGSGVATTANYAVAAIGTETSGSILSPSSKNSIVGFKPTIGVLSRSGIVPISSTLDTPGPMTKNVMDNAIVLSAMTGFDPNEPSTHEKKYSMNYWGKLNSKSDLKDISFGAFESLIESDSLYLRSVENLRFLGARVIVIKAKEIELEGFLTLLNMDMKYGLPQYLKMHYKGVNELTDLKDIMAFNKKDSSINMPYGQALFEGIIADTTTLEELELIKANLENSGRLFFDTAMKEYGLDAILSIDNYHAGFAAVAKYPCLTIPMGIKKSREPSNMTFIGKPFQEQELLTVGQVFQKNFNYRQLAPMYLEK